jgi:hypothetical protein
MAQTRPSFNYIESFFEIDITPEELKRIAGEMERMEAGFHIPGQVIRYKLSTNFAVTYRPEKKRPANSHVDLPIPTATAPAREAIAVEGNA